MAAVIRPPENYIQLEVSENFTKSDNTLYKKESQLNSGLRDTLNYMLGKPTRWKVRIKEVAKGVGACAETIRRRFKVLSERGYMKRVQMRAPGGGFGEIITYVSNRPIFKDSPPAFVPKFAEKAPENTANFTKKLQQNVVQQNVVPQNPHTYKDLDTSNTNLQQTSLYQNQSVILGSLKRAREVLENQIRVSKQTSSSRLSVSEDDSIFLKKKSWRIRIDGINAERRLGRPL